MIIIIINIRLTKKDNGDDKLTWYSEIYLTILPSSVNPWYNVPIDGSDDMMPMKRDRM